MEINLDKIQQEQAQWQKHNFGEQPPYRLLLGAVEEMGELAHAHLKEEQNIRGDSHKHQISARDSIGDVIIYLAGYCTSRGWNLSEVIDTTWKLVKQRDWKEDPLAGGNYNHN